MMFKWKNCREINDRFVAHISMNEWLAGRMLSHGKWDERNEHSTLTSTIFYYR